MGEDTAQCGVAEQEENHEDGTGVPHEMGGVARGHDGFQRGVDEEFLLVGEAEEVQGDDAEDRGLEVGEEREAVFGIEHREDGADEEIRDVGVGVDAAGRDHDDENEGEAQGPVVDGEEDGGGEEDREAAEEFYAHGPERRVEMDVAEEEGVVEAFFQGIEEREGVVPDGSVAVRGHPAGADFLRGGLVVVP